MQYLITQEELDALKANRGVSREAVNKALGDMGPELISIANELDPYPSSPFDRPVIKRMRAAIDKFKKAIDNIP